MFVGCELAGQRAAIVMSLVQSARMNGHDPWAYLRDVLQPLPTQRSSQIEALPHTDGSQRSMRPHDLAHTGRDGPGEHQRRLHEHAAKG